MASKFPPKDPNSVLDYTVDWTQWLARIADVIVTVEWIPGPGVEVVSSSNTSATATVWLRGGVDGEESYVTCRITTAGGRTQDCTGKFQVKPL